MLEMLNNYVSEYLPLLTGKIINTLTLLVIGYLANKVAQRLIHQVIRRLDHVKIEDPHKGLTPRLQTLHDILEDIAKVTIWGVIVIMVLSSWGFNITPIITGAGVIGLAVGFGSQTLVRDVVTGFFVLLENQFNVGDKIDLGGTIGRVKEINLRTTVLQSDDGSIHIIPNSQISKVSKNLPAEQPESKE